MTRYTGAPATGSLDERAQVGGCTPAAHSAQPAPEQAGGAYTNQLELRVIGMSRSGNHAIIQWLLNQAAGRTCFLNCAEGKSNPFASARPLHHGLPYEVNYPHFDWRAERAGQFSPKDLLVYSYEDSFLGYVCHPLFEQHHDRWVGSSRQRYDMLILRDPFNLFASRLRAGFSALSPATTTRVWKQHAREFLGERYHLRRPRLLVNYNRWATEQAYRRQLAGHLGLPFSDASIETVHPTGGGSSFDGLRYDGCAGRMKILERWQAYREDSTYWRLFDPQLVELAQRVFGPLPGMAAMSNGFSCENVTLRFLRCATRIPIARQTSV